MKLSDMATLSNSFTERLLKMSNIKVLLFIYFDIIIMQCMNL